jgi:tetratricopeptide (TPR) repeat protein
MSLPTKPKTPAKAESADSALEKGAPANPGKGPRPGILRKLGGLKQFIWPVVCLFQLGLLASLYLSWQGNNSAVHAPETNAPKGEDEPDSEPDAAPPVEVIAAKPIEEPSQASPAGPSSTPAVRAFTDSAQGDNFLRRGWYEQALAHYESMSEGRIGEMPLSLRFKIALCLDGLGHWDRAIAELGEVASRGANEQVGAAARIARVRLWFKMRNLDESKDDLCDLLLKSNSETSKEATVVIDLCHLLGLTLAMDALGKETPGPRHETVLAFSAPEWRPESQLIWTEKPAGHSSVKPEGKPDEPGSLDVWPTGPAVYDCDVTITAQTGSASEIIRSVADSANVSCIWTEKARAYADSRTLQVSTGRLPWPALVAGLTEPLRITWELRGDKLLLCGHDEISEEERIDRRTNAAKLILAAIARESHRFGDAGVAYLGLGNLAFADGQLDKAVSWFERFAREFPRSSQVVQAHYNLGVIQRSTGELAAARTSFFRAIDNSSAHVLTPLAHLFVGRIYLDESDPEGAIPALRRAVAMATGTGTRPAAVIDLVTAMMLTDNWRAASALLQEYHTILDQPEYRDAATFLATYSRYRLVTDRRQVPREGQLLISSLREIRADTSLSSSGMLLVGRAYAALGLSELMAETLEQTLERGVPKPIAHEISLELAEVAFSAGRGDEATRHLKKVYNRAKPVKSRRAGMRIAEIALADKRTDDCLDVLRQLLKEAEKSEVPPLLRLMGKAYEQAGDNQRAAQCFGGQLPPP